MNAPSIQVDEHVSHAAKAYLLLLSGICITLGSMAWHSNDQNNDVLSAFSMTLIPCTAIFILALAVTWQSAKADPTAPAVCHKAAIVATHFFVMFVEIAGIGLSAVTIYENNHTAQKVLAWFVLSGFFIYRACYTSTSILQIAALYMPMRLQMLRLCPDDPNTTLVVHEVNSTATLLSPPKRYADGQWL